MHKAVLFSEARVIQAVFSTVRARNHEAADGANAFTSPRKVSGKKSLGTVKLRYLPSGAKLFLYRKHPRKLKQDLKMQGFFTT